MSENKPDADDPKGGQYIGLTRNKPKPEPEETPEDEDDPTLRYPTDYLNDRGS